MATKVGGGLEATFGNSKAAVALAKMLAKGDDKASMTKAGKIGRVLSHYMYLLGVLQSIGDPVARQFFLTLLRERCVGTIGPVTNNKEKTVDSLARNLVVAAYREALDKSQRDRKTSLSRPAFQWIKRSNSRGGEWTGTSDQHVGLSVLLARDGYREWYDVIIFLGNCFLRAGSQPSLDKAKRFAVMWVEQHVWPIEG